VGITHKHGGKWYVGKTVAELKPLVGKARKLIKDSILSGAWRYCTEPVSAEPRRESIRSLRPH
jgi:hypothetical protein